MKILAIAASSSTKSINRRLVVHATGSITERLGDEAEVELIDLNEYEMPIYSQDREDADGVPDQAKQLFAKIGAADAIVISYAEHNGSYTAAFKNVYDWMSRIDMKVYQGTPMVALATSPGKGGGRNVLAAATSAAPHFGAELRGSLAVPSFYENFDVEQGVITNPELAEQLAEALTALTST